MAAENPARQMSSPLFTPKMNKIVAATICSKFVLPNYNECPFIYNTRLWVVQGSLHSSAALGWHPKDFKGLILHDNGFVHLTPACGPCLQVQSRKLHGHLLSVCKQAPQEFPCRQGAGKKYVPLFVDVWHSSMKCMLGFPCKGIPGLCIPHCGLHAQKGVIHSPHLQTHTLGTPAEDFCGMYITLLNPNSGCASASKGTSSILAGCNVKHCLQILSLLVEVCPSSGHGIWGCFPPGLDP